MGGVLLSVSGVLYKGSFKLPSPLSFSIQIDVSCLSFEGHQFQGKKAIMDKLNVSLSVHPAQKQCRQYFLSFFLYFTYMFAVMLGFFLCLCEFASLNLIFFVPCVYQSLPFTKIEHNITAQDHQPTPDHSIMSMVVGQLKVRSAHIFL